MNILKLKSLVDNVVKEQNSYIKEIVVKNEGEIIDYVRKQLYAGYITENGTNYRETYFNKKYAVKKYEMNPSASGYVDLRYTGSFYSKMYLANNNIDYFKIESRVDYTDDLKKRYGSDIMTFGNDYKQDAINEIFKPQILFRYRNELNLI